MMRTYVADRRGGQYVVAGCAVVWVLALSAATVARNEVWRSAIGLWTDTVAKSPTKFRPLMNLGTAYAERGKLQEGVSCYRKALQIEPGLISGYENLATVENSSGHHVEALLASEVGLQYEPRSWTLHFNKAVAYDALGQKEKCIEWFKKTIKLRPASKRSHIALGIVYASLKQYDAALRHYRIAASLPLLQEFDAQIRFNIAHIEQAVQQCAGQSMAMSSR